MAGVISGSAFWVSSALLGKVSKVGKTPRRYLGFRLRWTGVNLKKWGYLVLDGVSLPSRWLCTCLLKMSSIQSFRCVPRGCVPAN